MSWKLEAFISGAFPTNGGGVLPPLQLGAARAVANGSSAGQAQQLSQHNESLAGAATATLDLSAWAYDGPITVQVGTNMGYAQLHGLIIHAPKTNPGNVTIEAGASNGLELFGTDNVITLGPGEFVALGKAVTVDSTHKTLLITNSDSDEAAVVQFFVMGR